MMKFFKAASSYFTVAAILSAIVFVIPQCTEVDDSMGRNFIPKHQQMKANIDTVTSMVTYLVRNDSIPSSYQGRIFVGNMSHSTFGKIQGRAMTDFYPESTNFNDSKYFGHNPEAQKMSLEFYINDIYGNPEIEQTFHIYALQDSLRRDSVYIYNTPLERKVDLSRSLGTFKMKGERKNTVISKEVALTPLGLAFIQQIADTPKSIWEKPSSDFFKRFYGLYIAPEDGGPDAAVYELSLRANTNLGFYPAMVISAINYKEDEENTVDQELDVFFRFADTYPYPSMNVNQVINEYPASIEISDWENPAEMTPVSRAYIQSLGGVSTYLEFPDRLVEEIDALKTRDGETYSDIVINQARLILEMDEPNSVTRQEAPTRLGMYYEYAQPYLNATVTTGPIPIPDYTYSDESSVSGYTYKLPYHGHISKSNGYYMMDVTYYISKLVHWPDETPRYIWVNADVNTRTNKYTNVTLKGSETPDNPDKPIKLVLSYTLIR